MMDEQFEILRCKLEELVAISKNRFGTSTKLIWHYISDIANENCEMNKDG